MVDVDIKIDSNANAIIATVDLGAPLTTAWELWTNREILQKWWGPPEYPATFNSFSLEPGVEVSYFMTGPKGEKYHGWWIVNAANEPEFIEIMDGFGQSSTESDSSLPISVMQVRFSENSNGNARFVVETRYQDQLSLRKIQEMGVEEGFRSALQQIDMLI